MIMNPICAMVDHASEFLTADWDSIASPPKRAVKPPTATSTASTPGLSNITSAKRIRRKPPPLITPACSSAETGVGVSITSVSQPWTGNCADLKIAASASKPAARATPPGATPLARRGQDRRDVERAVAEIEKHRRADQRGIADPRDDEFLARGANGLNAVPIEKQEPMQAQARRDPGRDEQEQISRLHEQEHGSQRRASSSRETLPAALRRQDRLPKSAARSSRRMQRGPAWWRSPHRDGTKARSQPGRKPARCAHPVWPAAPPIRSPQPAPQAPPPRSAVEQAWVADRDAETLPMRPAGELRARPGGRDR